MKAGPLNPRASVRPLLDGTPLDLHVLAGTPYVLAARGDLTGSTIVATSYLRQADDSEAVDTASGGIVLTGFPGTEPEGTFVTTGNFIRITRAHAGGLGAPAVFISYIATQLSGAQ